jgi:flagellar basal-body rod modification protein FlgD
VTSPIGASGAIPHGASGVASISQILAQTPTKTTATPSNELGQDAFLKLLVAQLKYQDPSNPADSAEFLAQTAQFTQVEKLGQMAQEQQNLVKAQMMLTASGMVGRAITYPGPDGADVTGVVSSATFTGSTPTLRVGNTDVPLSSVKEVHHTA